MDNKYKLKTPFYCLAPMANISNYPFASQAIKYGADLVWTPMVHTDTIINNWAEAEKILDFKEISNYLIQIVGSSPESFVQAVKIVEEKLNPLGIDLNMACPDKNIVKSGCGGSLMRTPELMFEIAKAVRKCTKLPLSIKTRAGWENPEEIFGLLPKFEAIGIDLITIHGRTVRQGFKGEANWEIIRKIKLKLDNRNSKLILVGSGDVLNWHDAVSKQKETGADGIMIGRGALGKPWLFSEVKNQKDYEPSLKEIKSLVLDLSKKADLIWGNKGITESKKHFAWYFKGFDGAAEWRKRLMDVESLDDVKKILEI